MDVSDLLALLPVTTALRVFLPDLRAGMRSLLRTGARIGIAEVLRHQSPHTEAGQPHAAAVSRHGEA
ncbi:hypothetical protein ACWD3Z_46405 [Streptomyces sp. NPDC002740]